MGLKSNKDVRRKQVKAESLDGVKIIHELYATNFDSNFDDRYWRIGDIHLIENDKLKSQYEDYRKELIELGRPPDTIKETFAFSAESEKSCKDICQEGHKVGSKKRHILGHTGSGVHLVRHYDILTRYLMFQQYTSPAYIVVYKTYLGKTKPIVPRLHKDDNYVPPYMGFDSHVSARHIDKEMPICEALNCSYVYLYEFDPIASNPVKHPRQILPYVIIQLEKKVPSVPENPFLAVGTDETRSTWEVKGETRRGFRFMFTKSGLKGKHKVFTKGCNMANFGSYLKGQILEMRTKSAGSVSEVKPPLLQKIDESSKNINAEASKPPDLQRFSKSCLQSPSKKKSFRKDIENLVISDSLRKNRQLLNLKPCIKLKRLNSIHFKGASFRITKENDTSASKDSVEPKANFETNGSDDSKLSSAKEDKGKVLSRLQKSETERPVSKDCENGKNEPILVSGGATVTSSKRKKIKERKTIETHLSNSSIVNSDILPESTRSTEKTMKVKTSDNGGDKIETLNHKSNKSTDETMSTIDKILDVETQIRVRTTAKILDEYKKKNTTDRVEDKSDMSMRKDESLYMCSENVQNSKKTYVKPSENVAPSASSAIDNDSNVNTSVQKYAGASNFTTAKSADNKESKSNSKVTHKITKIDERKLEKGDNVDLLEIKSKSEQKHALDGCLYKTDYEAAKLKDLRLRDTRENSLRIVTNKDKADEKTPTHRKEKGSKVYPEKGKKRKTISPRCYRTKTKFGMTAYTVNKSKARTGQSVKGKYFSNNNSKPLEKGKTQMQIKEYEFPAPSISQDKKHNPLNRIPVRRAQDCSEKSSKSYVNANEMITSPSGYILESELIGANKHSHGQSVASEVGFEKHTDTSSNNLARSAKIAEPDRYFKKQSQNQTQRIVLEKSKSPVVANAAPDILNICPFPTPAQTSTCPISDRSVSIQNESVSTKGPARKEKQADVYQETDLYDKRNIFFSEMSELYGKTDKIQTIEFIKQFPGSFNRNIVVSPVLRVTPNAEIPAALDEKQKSRIKNRTHDQSQNNLDNDANNRQTVTDTSLQQNEANYGMAAMQISTQLVVDSKDNKSATPPSKYSMKGIRPQRNKKNASNETNNKAADVSSNHNQIIAPMKPPNVTEIPSIDPAEGKAVVSSSSRTTGMKGTQSKLGSKLRSKCKTSTSACKDENKNDRKSKDKNVLPIKTSVMVKNDSSNTTEKHDLLHSTCSNQNLSATSGSGKDHLDKLDSCRQHTKSECFERKTENFRTTEKEKTEIPISSEDNEITIENNSDPKTQEQQHYFEMSDSANVKIDTFAADRFRTYLALQHRKSSDQKSDTEVEDTSSSQQNQGIDRINTKNVIEPKISMKQKRNTASKNSIDCSNQKQNRKSLKQNHEDKLKECSNSKVAEVSDKKYLSFSEKPKETIKKNHVHSLDGSKTKHIENLLKQPTNSFLKHNMRSDSAEMHDSDSQDTVIGGVRDSPMRYVTSRSASQEHLKSVDLISKQVKPLATQLEITCDIKQEKIVEGYHEETMSNDQANNTVSASDSHPHIVNENIPNTFDTHLVNQLSSNTLSADKRQTEIFSNNEIKEEPIDPVSDTTSHLTSPLNIGTQPVKSEPCSPTTIFPAIRRELAKGSAMLNATECRSAIVDTLKELSSVLKFLTENNTQSPKQTEKVALVAKRMCNVLSGESTIEASKTEECVLTKDPTNNENSGHDLNIKTEPIDIEFSKSMKSFSQNKDVTPGDSLCRSESEENNHWDNECPSSGHEFQYEYILKPSEDDYQSACESVERHWKYSSNKSSNDKKPLPDNNSTAPNEHSIHNKSSQQQFFSPKSCTAMRLSDEHEKDELPRLFDPNEEPDICCIEQFGIPRKLCRNNKEAMIHTEFPLEKTSADHYTNTATPENILLKEIKMEKDTDCAAIRLKPKQRFNLKTGVLNKGLKERKNMFDLKINSSRRKLVSDIKSTNGQVPVTPTMQNTKISTSEKCVIGKTEKDHSAIVEKPCYFNYHEETDGIMNEVYKTVCEKLTTLKESTIVENSDGFPVGLSNLDPTKRSECKPSINSKSADPDEYVKPQSISEDGKNENDMSAVKVIIPKEEVKKANAKKQAVIPFHTVLKLKRQQFWKYKRGETNKKFIDYKELFSKMSSRRRDKSYGNPSDIHKDQKTYSKQKDSTDISKPNETLGKKMNYFISSGKTSAMSERGTALIEDSKSKEWLPETVNLKRNISDAEEGNSSKRIKLSSDKTERKESDSHRSRSRSSPGSSTSRNRSVDYSPSSSSKHISFINSQNADDYSIRLNRPYSKFSHKSKPFYTQRTYFSRGSYRRYPARINQNVRMVGRPSFNKNGTGYFSWRRKYQPQRNVSEGYIATDSGSIHTVSEYAKWTRFKERETLRDQIENAIKEYRRTFENTPDDFKGDEKVASYLSFLTDKLDTIQSKRDKLSMVETDDDRRRMHRRSTSSEKVPSRSPQPRRDNESLLFRKLEKSHNFHQHETQKHSSVTRFSGSLASDSDSLSYKQRRHASGIEELLKEHIAKHCEHLTKQIKQEMVDFKTSKSGSTGGEHKDSSYHSDSPPKKYNVKETYRDDKYRRHSRERYDSHRTSTGQSSRHREEYSKDYHGSRDKSYERKYCKHPKDRYDDSKYSYDRMDRGDKYDNKYSYGDNYERRQDYRPRYDKDFYSKFHWEYDAGIFDDNRFADESSRNGTDRNYDRGQDYRKTYDYQQNFDKYQETLQEKHGHLKGTSFRQKRYDGDIRNRLGFRKTGQHSKTYLPHHWSRGKYNHINRDKNDSKDKPEVRNENDVEEDMKSVQSEFDATRYRRFTPTFRGYNKRGRGFSSGLNKFQPAYKQYQPAKFTKVRNPATYFSYGDKDTGNDNKKGNKSDSGNPTKDSTSVKITLGKSAKKSICQGQTSIKSQQSKLKPMSGIQKTAKTEEL